MNLKIKILALITTLLFLLGFFGAYLKIVTFNDNRDNNNQDNNNEEDSTSPITSAIDIYINQEYECNYPLEEEYIAMIKNKYDVDNLDIKGKYYFDFIDNEYANNGIVVVELKTNNIKDYNKVDITNIEENTLEDENNLTKYIIIKSIFGFKESKEMNINQYYHYLKNIKIDNCHKIN